MIKHRIFYDNANLSYVILLEYLNKIYKIPNYFSI